MTTAGVWFAMMKEGGHECARRKMGSTEEEVEDEVRREDSDGKGTVGLSSPQQSGWGVEHKSRHGGVSE